eukprot:5537608-Amphidinium_carterae.2
MDFLRTSKIGLRKATLSNSGERAPEAALADAATFARYTCVCPQSWHLLHVLQRWGGAIAQAVLHKARQS